MGGKSAPGLLSRKKCRKLHDNLFRVDKRKKTTGRIPARSFSDEAETRSIYGGFGFEQFVNYPNGSVEERVVHSVIMAYMLRTNTGILANSTEEAFRIFRKSVMSISTALAPNVNFRRFCALCESLFRNMNDRDLVDMEAAIRYGQVYGVNIHIPTYKGR